MDTPSSATLVLEPLLEAVQNAGEAILKIYESDFAVEYKQDDSPLTQADRAANTILTEYLQSCTPTLPIISEESRIEDYDQRRVWERFWLLDPLDGTKEFVKKNGEFTVNVALVEKGEPVLGVVYQPTAQLFYVGVKGEGAFKQSPEGRYELQRVKGRWQNQSTVRVVASRSHQSEETLQFVEGLRQQGKEVEFLSVGSSLKICLVAEGKADLYPRFGPTMEWDTAAAHAVAIAAGCRIEAVPDGKELKYNKKNLLNPHFIVE